MTECVLLNAHDFEDVPKGKKSKRKITRSHLRLDSETEVEANLLLLDPSILHSSKNRSAITAGKVKHLC